MAFSAEGFFQGTAQAIPQAWHLYKEASLLPMQREAMQTQLAMSQLQLQKAKEAEAEMKRPYRVDYLMAQHGLDPETREGKAFNSFFSQFTDDKGTIYGSQFPAIKNVMEMTDFKTSLLKARMEDAQEIYETSRDKYQKKMIKMKEEGYPGYKPDFMEQKKMSEELKQLQMYQDRYEALSDQYYKTENRKMAQLEVKHGYDMAKAEMQGFMKGVQGQETFEQKKELLKLANQGKIEAKKTPPGRAVTPGKVNWWERSIQSLERETNRSYDAGEISNEEVAERMGELKKLAAEVKPAAEQKAEVWYDRSTQKQYLKIGSDFVDATTKKKITDPRIIDRLRKRTDKEQRGLGEGNLLDEIAAEAGVSLGGKK